MHETRFVNEILAVLKQNVDKDAALKKVVVNVRLSIFSHVAAESLQKSIKELIKDDNFKNVRFKILPLGVLLECKNCKRSTHVTKRVFCCPFCNSADINIQMNREFFVESLEIGSKEEKA
jgi:hydrogenase nickel incorporation protein HypA/HybF